MMSKKKAKASEYFQAHREADRKYEQLGLCRPQDEHKELRLRTRLVNMGKLNYTMNPNFDSIQESKLLPFMMTSKKNWHCYSSAHEQGTPAPKWISTSDDFGRMMKDLKQCQEIAIDVECHNYHTLKGFICLIQIATWEYGDFLIDPFKVQNDIKTDLKSILEDADVLKVAHDVRNDSKWFQRDFDIFLVGCVDIQVLYGLSSEDKMVSLKSFFKIYYPNLKELFEHETFSDWRLRPGKGMTRAQETYAVNDVHIALRIFDQLRNEVTELELIEAYEMTKTRLYPLSSDIMPASVGPNFCQQALNELRRSDCSKQGKNWRVPSLELPEMNTLTSLFEWRHGIAQVLDENPDHVVRGSKLIDMACMKNPLAKDLRKIIGKCHPAVVGATATEQNQIKIIQYLIETEGTYVEYLREIECHNCLTKGHGPAWSCPFSKQEGSLKLYMNRPENKQFRIKQQFRRYERIKSKFGKEKADRELAKWRSAAKKTG